MIEEGRQVSRLVRRGKGSPSPSVETDGGRGWRERSTSSSTVLGSGFSRVDTH